MSQNITATAYTLYDERGNWLGQVVLTSDGMFASVTDYGNLSYAWRAYGSNGDFKKFICGLNTDYFGTKLFSGVSYIVHSKAIEKACKRFAEKILPALQEVLKKELATLGDKF